MVTSLITTPAAFTGILGYRVYPQENPTPWQICSENEIIVIFFPFLPNFLLVWRKWSNPIPYCFAFNFLISSLCCALLKYCFSDLFSPCLYHPISLSTSYSYSNLTWKFHHLGGSPSLTLPFIIIFRDRMQRSQLREKSKWAKERATAGIMGLILRGQ